MSELSEDQAAFLRENAYPATVTTLREDGSPHSTVVWIDEVDGEVWFNTARGRAKDKHLRVDPRVSVLVMDPKDQFKWVAVSGTASLQEEGADAHIDKLAKKYLDADSYPYRNDAETREIVRIRVDVVDSSGL